MMKSGKRRDNSQSGSEEDLKEGENKAKISKLGVESSETAIRCGDVVVKTEPVDFDEADEILFGQECSQPTDDFAGQDYEHGAFVFLPASEEYDTAMGTSQDLPDWSDKEDPEVDVLPILKPMGMHTDPAELSDCEDTKPPVLDRQEVHVPAPMMTSQRDQEEREEDESPPISSTQQVDSGHGEVKKRSKKKGPKRKRSSQDNFLLPKEITFGSGMIPCKDCHCKVEYDSILKHMYEAHQYYFLLHTSRRLQERTLWAVELSSLPSKSCKLCKVCGKIMSCLTLLNHMTTKHGFLLQCPFVQNCLFTCAEFLDLITHLEEEHQSTCFKMSQSAQTAGESSEVKQKNMPVCPVRRNHHPQRSVVADSQAGTDQSSAIWTGENKMLVLQVAEHFDPLAADISTAHLQNVDEEPSSTDTGPGSPLLDYSSLAAQKTPHRARRKEGNGKLTEEHASGDSIKLPTKTNSPQGQILTMSEETKFGNTKESGPDIHPERDKPLENGSSPLLHPVEGEPQGSQPLVTEGKLPKDEPLPVLSFKGRSQSLETRTDSGPSNVRQYGNGRSHEAVFERQLTSRCPECHILCMTLDKLKWHLFFVHQYFILDCQPPQNRLLAIPTRFPRSCTTPKCTDCDEHLETGLDMLQHMTGMHGYELACPNEKCGKCPFRCKEPDTLSEHLEDFHGVVIDRQFQSAIKSEASSHEAPEGSSEPEGSQDGQSSAEESETTLASTCQTNDYQPIRVQVNKDTSTLCPECHMVSDSHPQFMRHMFVAHFYIFLLSRDPQKLKSSKVLAVPATNLLELREKPCLICAQVLGNSLEMITHLIKQHKYQFMCPYMDNFFSSVSSELTCHFRTAHKLRVGLNSGRVQHLYP